MPRDLLCGLIVGAVTLGACASPEPTLSPAAVSTGAIAGRALAGGKPVVGAIVSVQFSPLRTRTDADGRFVLRVAPGPVRLKVAAAPSSASLPDGMFQAAAEEIEAPKTGVVEVGDLPLAATGTVRGTVKLIDRGPNQHDGIYLLDPGSAIVAVTNDSGAVELPMVPAGPRTFVAWFMDYPPVTIHVTVPPGGTVEFGPIELEEIFPPPSGDVSGRVLADVGEDATAAREGHFGTSVTLRSMHGLTTTAVTSADGTWRAGPLTEGMYIVEMTRAGHHVAVLPHVFVHGGRKTTYPTVRLRSVAAADCDGDGIRDADAADDDADGYADVDEAPECRCSPLGHRFDPERGCLHEPMLAPSGGIDHVPVARVEVTSTEAPVVGVPIRVDGSASFDGDGQAITYNWVVFRPDRNDETIGFDSAAEYVPFLEGRHFLVLFVDDGKTTGLPGVRTVQVGPKQ